MRVGTAHLKVSPDHIRDVHIVRGRTYVLVLLTSEYINADQVDLGVTVLARLGRGHLDDLAGTALQEDVPVLTEGGALGRVGLGSTSVSRLIVFIRHGSLE